jgi:hypothetical protein
MSTSDGAATYTRAAALLPLGATGLRIVGVPAAA